MKVIYILLLIGLFACKEKEKVEPVDPNLGKAMVLDFSYTFTYRGGNEEPEFNKKDLQTYYNPHTDALLIYWKRFQPVFTNLGTIESRYDLNPCPVEFDSTLFTYRILSEYPSNRSLFMYALRKSSNPQSWQLPFKGYQYAFGTKDSTCYFRAVIIKGNKGPEQSNLRRADLALPYEELQEKYSITYIK